MRSNALDITPVIDTAHGAQQRRFCLQEYVEKSRINHLRHSHELRFVHLIGCAGVHWQVCNAVGINANSVL